MKEQVRGLMIRRSIEDRRLNSLQWERSRTMQVSFVSLVKERIDKAHDFWYSYHDANWSIY